MSFDVQLAQEVEKYQEPEAYRRFRDVISDAYAFVRSAEANQAFATVTLDQMIGDQILRNGESSGSNAAQYNPYSYTPSKELPAGTEPGERANFLSAADTGSAITKLGRIQALTNELSKVIEELKKTEATESANSGDLIDEGEISAPDEETEE